MKRPISFLLGALLHVSDSSVHAQARNDGAPPKPDSSHVIASPSVSADYKVPPGIFLYLENTHQMDTLPPWRIHPSKLGSDWSYTYIAAGSRLIIRAPKEYHAEWRQIIARAWYDQGRNPALFGRLPPAPGITLHAKADGTVNVGEKTIAPDTLFGVLTRLAAVRPQPVVYVKWDENEEGRAAAWKVADRCREAGLRRLTAPLNRFERCIYR